MDPALLSLLEDVRAGRVTPGEALARLRDLPFADLGFARVDHHRAVRCGFPEVVFCQGKEASQAAAICRSIVDHGSPLLATRVSEAMWRQLQPELPGAVYHPAARAVTRRTRPAEPAGLVVVLAAGTSDAAVAEEARVTAEMMGARVSARYDVGVAGLHRLLDCLEEIRGARAVVVAAGMEGALPSVVAGLVDVPVVAVPTSVGYGASFGGLAALLGMLNACAAGVTVVNIDNGFGAGYAAGLINRRAGSDGL